MKTRALFLALTLAVVAVLAAGCGGGGNGSVPADAVAKVGSTPIPKASLNAAISYAIAISKSRGQPPPKVGTAAYTQLRGQVVTFLVNEEEFQQEGKKLGVTVTQQDVKKQVSLIKRTHFNGSEKKLDEALRKSNITLAQLEQFNLAPNLLTQRLEAKVTKNVTVSTSDAQKYYDQNKATFSTPAQTTRSVRHILVSSKGQADKLETQLKNGASFAVLAKKYSKDTGSAQNGGKLNAIKGQLVKPFQDVAFSLKTGKISPPVRSQFGWHIIQALGPVKQTAAHTQAFAQVKPQIVANLSQQKQGAAWQAWVAKVASDFKGKVKYQTGYAPATTPTISTPTTTG